MIVLTPKHNFNQNLANSYNCPLYRTADRYGTILPTGKQTNFITYLQLPSIGNPLLWKKAGVAAFLSTKL